MTEINRPKKTEEKLPTAIQLSDLSIESLEVLEHFGIEAPNLLNNFFRKGCCV